MNITILGAGAWGTALAISLSSHQNVLLWGRNTEALEEAAKTRENRTYLPGFILPDSIQVSTDLNEAIAHAASTADNSSLILLATSVAGLRPLSKKLRDYDIPNLVWLCKGFEERTGLLPHQIIHDVFPATASLPIGALSGPSFAQEVASGLPCALTIASSSSALCQQMIQAMQGSNLRVYSSDDLTGVEVGGAVKNILAIAVGIADGLGLGANARAALLTRGLAEISRLGLAMGARPETLMGLTGMGDLILTCTGDLSRNRRVGLALAKGQALDTIIQDLGHVAEGVRCVRAVCALAAKKEIEMPIANAVSKVLFGGASPNDMVAQLLARENKAENA